MASHPFILLFYLITGFINRLVGIFHKNTTEKNYFINKSVVSNTDDRILDNQNEKSGLKYGSKTFAHSGCGIAAVYNALLLLGRPVPLPEIIRHFERRGASMFAAFGTAPQSAVKFLKDQGLHVEKASNKRHFETLEERSEILIFTIMNNRKSIRRMLHTMCIEHLCPGSADAVHHTEGGSERFIVHNFHGRSETYVNYDDMMNSLGDGKGHAEGVYMIRINSL